jgi:ribose transport system substrate-binding protein
MKLFRLLSLSTLVLSLVLLTACSGKKDGDTNNDPGGEKYGKYTLRGVKYDYVDLAKAKNNAADILTQLEGKDNVCLIGLWAYNPPQILNAVKSAGREGKVHIIGFDEYDATLQGILDGYIHATVVQHPFRFGYESVKVMAALARGEKPELPKEVGKDGVWHIPHRVIKKKDVDDFWAQLKKYKKEAEGNVPKSDITVAFVSNNAEEFWTFAEAGARTAAREFKANVIFRKPQTGSADEQSQMVRALLDQVKAIAISVNDPINQKKFLNDVADKIPLLTVDNDAPDTQRKYYIGTDNIAAGHEVGKLVKEVIPKGGDIAIFVGKPDPLNAQQRRDGVLDELKKQ